MKARCVNNFGAAGYLERGKIYDVIQHDTVPAFFRIGNDGWEKHRFELIANVVPGNVLPTDPAARKNIPIVRGCLDYFPAALAAVAELSRIGNKQHNPGQEMHHARGKSTDHADCIVRHTMQRGTFDTDGVRHATKAAWRALALLQEELEAAGAPLARGAKLPSDSSQTVADPGSSKSESR